jgi:pimeloyl-ACP methyl ester carboxylesterase
VTTERIDIRKRRVRRAAMVSLVLLALAATPTVRTRVKAAVTMGDALGLPVPRPFAADVAPEPATVDGVVGRMYESGDRALLIVPGAAPAGMKDPRVNAVAEAFARSGHSVFIPQLDLYGEELTDADLERIVTSALGLARSSSHPVAMLGISYGGSLALIATADERLDGRISRVATFGAYYDLVGLVQAITTGVSLVDGEEIPWEGHPQARDILFARVAGLLPEPDRSELVDALGGTTGPDRLPAATRSVYDLLTNRDPTLTYELAGDLPDRLRRFLERFSPSSVSERVEVPIAALHSTDDPVVPYGELIRLQSHLPEARVTEVEMFKHVDFNAASPTEWLDVTPDLMRLWGFTTWLLAEG